MHTNLVIPLVRGVLWSFSLDYSLIILNHSARSARGLMTPTNLSVSLHMTESKMYVAESAPMEVRSQILHFYHHAVHVNTFMLTS